MDFTCCSSLLSFLGGRKAVGWHILYPFCCLYELSCLVTRSHFFHLFLTCKLYYGISKLVIPGPFSKHLYLYVFYYSFKYLIYYFFFKNSSIFYSLLLILLIFLWWFVLSLSIHSLLCYYFGLLTFNNGSFQNAFSSHFINSFDILASFSLMFLILN